MEIRRLTPEDAKAYWNLRLEALQMEPLAYGSAAEEYQATTVEETEQRIRDTSEPSFILGGFDRDTLVGIVTFASDAGLKERHKGHIRGFYVTAAHRNKGVGHELLSSLLKMAKEDLLLEQVLLAVATCQEAAIRMYRNFGFEVYGTEPRALKVESNYIDEHQMILRVR